MIATQLRPYPQARVISKRQFPARIIYRGTRPVNVVQAAIDQLVRYGAPAEPVERLLRSLPAPVNQGLRQNPDQL